jgi:osmoprotectant transport system permease protein
MSAFELLTMNALTPLILDNYIEYLANNSSQLWGLFLEHILIVIDSVWLATCIGVTLGVVITYDDRLATAVLWLAGIMLTIPSIALFGILIPFLGIGKVPTVVALVLYAQLPIIRNTYIGLTQVDQATLRAGKGIGMTQRQRLWHIQLPKSVPIIMAGVRNSVVILVGIAAIAAYIGAGGLGDPIFDGISSAYTAEIVVATVIVSLLALAFDYGFRVIEQLFRLRNGEDINPGPITQLVRRAT